MRLHIYSSATQPIEDVWHSRLFRNWMSEDREGKGEEEEERQREGREEGVYRGCRGCRVLLWVLHWGKEPKRTARVSQRPAYRSDTWIHPPHQPVFLDNSEFRTPLLGGGEVEGTKEGWRTDLANSSFQHFRRGRGHLDRRSRAEGGGIWRWCRSRDLTDLRSTLWEWREHSRSVLQERFAVMREHICVKAKCECCGVLWVGVGGSMHLQALGDSEVLHAWLEWWASCGTWGCTDHAQRNWDDHLKEREKEAKKTNEMRKKVSEINKQNEKRKGIKKIRKYLWGWDSRWPNLLLGCYRQDTSLGWNAFLSTRGFDSSSSIRAFRWGSSPPPSSGPFLLWRLSTSSDPFSWR